MPSQASARLGEREAQALNAAYDLLGRSGRGAWPGWEVRGQRTYGSARRSVGFSSPRGAGAPGAGPHPDDIYY